MSLMKPTGFLFAMAAMAVTFMPSGMADEVTDWNQVFLDAALTANTPPYVAPRFAAIVESAVFDAVNGIERRFTPFHVAANGPPGASPRAAAVQAAYETLVSLYPNQKSTFDAKLVQSLAGIASASAAEHSMSIARGIEWGHTVAQSILAWRATDGANAQFPPFLGGTAPGEWRPTPPAFLPGVGFAVAHTTPWVISSASQFRPGPPPDLTSNLYAANLNETKDKGLKTSATRTADETVAATFWASASVTYLWNHVAVQLGLQRKLSLLDNARLLAQLNVVTADAAIATFDAKYTYAFWRPVTAIPLADTDGNPATTADPAWVPLIVTPAHPEYPSAHSTFSSSAAAVLANYFGEYTTSVFDSNTLPGVMRTFSTFSDVLADIANARIDGGIHYRNSCNIGEALGTSVAQYSMEHSFQPVRGSH